ncbi:hypothetical protein KC19_3G013400 [Ceratodon purpureus]|uniref:Uncharacterized protein n=1 Tax=Ceratodon purpureus TaxID=3225 RepID=A0A8T0IEP3_CERPU|nr:hypothetical protein KC19_3G013400 [Ceratodon purpureus]
MPGFRCPGPTITAPSGNYSFLHDSQTPAGKESTWDRPVDLNYEHLPPVEAMPFDPNLHKACRPPHFHSEWMKGKGGSASNAFFGSGIPPPGLCPSPHGKDCNDYDEELAVMVDDFIESGSSSLLDGNDSDGGPPSIVKICNTLQTLTSSYGGIEGELLNAVWKLVLAIDFDTDLICNLEGADCRGGCIKRLVACRLRDAGYDAAVCKSKWEGSGHVLQGTVQMGEYEYIDVKVCCNQSVERLIVDVDFQDQFVLARATPNHLSALKLLPIVFVGTTKRLEQILQIMSESVKLSLKQNSMPLPPWRTLNFYHSKWLSSDHERIVDNSSRGRTSLTLKGRLPSMPEIRQCDVQLRRVKDSLLSEANGSSLNILARGRSSRPHSKSRGKRSIIY